MIFQQLVAILVFLQKMVSARSSTPSSWFLFRCSDYININWLCYCLVTQSCPTPCDPKDCSLPGSSIHETLQARVLEWGAISFSRVSSQPRDRTQVSCIAGNADDTTLMAESKEELKSLWMRIKEESGKAGLKLSIQKAKIMSSGSITSRQIDGKKWKQWQTLFTWASKSQQIVTAAVKLKDACSLEEKLWQT